MDHRRRPGHCRRSAAAAPARAGLVPVQVSVMPEGDLYRFTYAIVLPTDSVLRPGDYFTIYDFDGYVGGTEMASGSAFSTNWGFATDLIGPTPDGVMPDDNPAITNLIVDVYRGRDQYRRLDRPGELLGPVALPGCDRLVVHGLTGTTGGRDGQQHYPNRGSRAQRTRYRAADRARNRPPWPWPGFGLPLVGLARWSSPPEQREFGSVPGESLRLTQKPGGSKSAPRMDRWVPPPTEGRPRPPRPRRRFGTPDRQRVRPEFAFHGG